METIKGIALVVVSALMGMFALRVANTWDIPVDNQIGMACFGCFFIGVSFITMIVETRLFIKRLKKN